LPITAVILSLRKILRQLNGSGVLCSAGIRSYASSG
jgi:hypothetical protein